jgi:hypothetical protein
VDKLARKSQNKKRKFYYKQFNLPLQEKELRLLLEILVKLDKKMKLEFIVKEDLNSFSKILLISLLKVEKFKD